MVSRMATFLTPAARSTSTWETRRCAPDVSWLPQRSKGEIIRFGAWHPGVVTYINYEKCGTIPVLEDRAAAQALMLRACLTYPCVVLL